ncbi:MAG TPA: tRNA lysidine(34) synthetase TilS [Candidatus Saccharimonadales bacterium]|nr:tRNA lysidine(34) synthetase TilS [Candidatus Saccharimonadales bacterium]
MKVNLPKGSYVVAVSGGVDSVVLLHLMARQPQLDLVVAHFDHGIRPDSHTDRQFVADLAHAYGIPFVSAKGQLGAAASEAVAREARYAFLREVQHAHGARAIVTAHHQDDVLETAILNLLRGTGRKGLTSLQTTDEIVRPLLAYDKQLIRSYAVEHGLTWREDSTNSQTRYLRNYIRHHVLPKLTPNQRAELLHLLERQRSVNAQLDALLLQRLEPPVERLQRGWFISLPHAIATETMASWLRVNGIRDFDKATIERAVIGSKTARVGKKIALKHHWTIDVGTDFLALVLLER